MDDQANKVTEAAVATVAADAAAKAVDPPVAVADAGKVVDVSAKAPDAGKATDKTVGADKAKPADAAKGKATTVVEAAAAAQVAAPAWGDSWRKDLAGDDEKLLKRLERFSGPKDILDWALNAEKKIGKGLPRPAADAPPEEQKAWREANGVPETPDKYTLTLKDGLVLGDEDRPMFDIVAAAAHAAGISNEGMSAVTGAVLEATAKQQALIIDEDNKHYADSVKARIEKLGGQAEYDEEVELIVGPKDGRPGLFEEAGRELRDLILGARMENGRKIGGDAAALEFLGKLAKQVVMPRGTWIGDADNSGRGIDSEIAEIERTMQTEPRKYWSDPKMQERYGNLLSRRTQLQERSQKAA